MNTAMLHFATITLLCLFPHAKADDCDPQHIDWAPGDKTNKAIDDCDLLRDQMTVHFDRLTKKPNCLTQVKVKMINSQADYPELNLRPKQGTFVYGKTISFKNFIPKFDRCLSVAAKISTQVYSNGKNKKYETHFSLDPKGCTMEKDGVDFEEYSSTLNCKPTNTTTTTTETTSTTEEKLSIQALLIPVGSGVTIISPS